MGLLRGSIKDKDKVFIYGNSGIWMTDSTGLYVSDFNAGLPEGADFRNIKAMTQTPGGSLFAAGQFGLYRNDGTYLRPRIERGYHGSSGTFVSLYFRQSL